MALAYRTLLKNCYNIQNITKPVKWAATRSDTNRILSSGICFQNSYYHRSSFETKHISLLTPSRQLSTNLKDNDAQKPGENKGDVKPENLFQKFKRMYKDYWYVVVPVHFATSGIWFGCFYYAVRSGVDVIGLLQTLGISETIINKLKDSGAGYFALAFALYKVVTPLRYAVTVGATTVAIKRLTAIGWIRPVPSPQRLKEIYQEKKDNIQDRFNESKHSFKEKRFQVMEEMKRYKAEMRNIKDKVKKM